MLMLFAQPEFKITF